LSENLLAAADMNTERIPGSSLELQTMKCVGIRTIDTVFAKIRSREKRVNAGKERGGSTIELILVMPILMLILTGVTTYGLTLHNLLVLTNAVNAGAQLLAFSRGQTTDPCATTSSAITSAAPSLGTGLSLTFVINGSSYSGTTCTAGAANMVQAASAQVTATYPCTLILYGVVPSACSLKAQITEVIQ
jgi:Flp pilus assembly protein TadG